MLQCWEENQTMEECTIEEMIRSFKEYILTHAAEAVSMILLTALFVYSNEIFQAWKGVLLIRRGRTREGITPQQHERSNKNKQEDYPLMDSTEGSLDEDFKEGRRSYQVSVQHHLHHNHHHHQSATKQKQPLSHIATSKNSSRIKQQQQRPRPRRSYSSCDMIPEESALLAEVDFHQDEEEDDTEATVCRSNSSPRHELMEQSAILEEEEAGMEQEQPFASPIHMRKPEAPRLRRSTVRSAAALKEQLSQKMQLPHQAQRLNAVSTSTLLRASSFTRKTRGNFPPPPHRHHQRSQSQQTMLCAPSLPPRLGQPHRRASSLSVLTSYSTDHNMVEDSKEEDGVFIELKRSQRPVAPAGRTRRSSGGSIYFEEDARLLERLERSIRPSTGGNEDDGVSPVLNRTIHLTPNTPTDSVLSSP